MALEHAVPLGRLLIEEHPDLLQAHAGGLAAHDDSDAHQVVVGIATPVATVPIGAQQPDALPVPQHVSGQVEPGRGIPDRHLA